MGCGDEKLSKYLTQTFSNRYLGRVLLEDQGERFFYELIHNGAVESV